MAKQARDVTGGVQTWGAMIPGYGLFNYMLGLFSVPIETFLRIDFGERYYSKGSYFGGLVILVIFNLLTKFFAWIIDTFSSVHAAEENHMWTVIVWYFWIGLGQFVIIWVRDAVGQPRHSFESGRPLLLFLGKGLIKLMNLLIGFAVRIIAIPMTGKAKILLLGSLPVLRDTRTFTERFVEPVVVFFAANYALNHGQLQIFLWLLFSVIALNLSTSTRHEQERAFALDFRDQMIEARAWQEIMEGKNPDNAQYLRRTLNETIGEVEKNPEIFDSIKDNQPKIARAIEAVRARQKKAPLPDSPETSESTPEAV